MWDPADSVARFSIEQDAGDSGGEAEEMMNLLITQALIEGAAALSSLIRAHWEGDTIHLWSVLWAATFPVHKLSL